MLRVPPSDWLPIKHGRKTEIRMVGRAVTQFGEIEVPTPVLFYSERGRGFDSKLMVLEQTWTEPLGAIAGNEESLRREGFPDFASFRRYWTIRTHRRFPMMKTCIVYRFREASDGDLSDLGRIMLHRLYPDHVPNL